MHHVPPEALGPAPSDGVLHADKQALLRRDGKWSSLPLGRSHVSYAALCGPSYVTAQVLVQHAAFALSHQLYACGPEGFDLDLAVSQWSQARELNGYGYPPRLSAMQLRPGVGTLALGHMFAKDFDFAKRHIPQTLIGSSASLRFFRSALDQLSLLYAVASPFVAHIAAVDYVAGAVNALVADYASPLALVDELGLGMVCSASAHETQHMALFSTLLASIVPTVHIYDGVTVGRETTRVTDALDSAALYSTYLSVSEEASKSGTQRDSAESRLQRLLQAFNGELGTSYNLFEYHGHAEAEHILVVFGTLESQLSAAIAQKLAQSGRKVAVVSVRVYRPFAEEEFLRVLPASVATISVLGQVHDELAVADEAIHSVLYEDVLAAVTFSHRWRTAPPSVFDQKYAREHCWTPAHAAAVLGRLGAKNAISTPFGADAEPVARVEDDDAAVARAHIHDPAIVSQCIVWDVDDSVSSGAPYLLAEILAAESAHPNVAVRSVQNNFMRGGIRRTDIRTSKRTIELSYAIEQADVSYVGDVGLFKEANILDSIKPSGVLVARIPSFKDGDLEKYFPAAVRKDIASKAIKLSVVDPEACAASKEDSGLETYLIELALIQASQPDLLETGLSKIGKLNGHENIIQTIASGLGDAVRAIQVPEAWATAELQEPEPALPTIITPTSFTSFDREPSAPKPLLHSWHAAAKRLTFKEAYGTTTALRPDLSVKTWTVHVKEKRRLTPETYERNVFHIEFDLGTSGLRYDIGEALGIHAENDEAEVQQFIKDYGLDADALVEVPSREDADVLELRTVYQALLRNVDIFGRPPKKFYEALAEYADDPKEKEDLLSLASPVGATEFKRRAEVDTVTYADLLLEYASARPGIYDLLRIVSPMKRREYSIASSQKVTPQGVALLVVTVGWTDPRGRRRFGQATRYLDALRVGAAVTVSVKASVMKLPARAAQPIILAGLGTGLAPFRAFVQHRAWQRAQGEATGAVLLYLGARRQREEYLYGEEWEAYRDAGVITLLGRAFSRDQAHKVYIQDRMRQTRAAIEHAYLRQAGSFYLCGPTWPVPDVTAVLQEAIAAHAQAEGRKVDARREIERLKDESRYVLEVY